MATELKAILNLDAKPFIASLQKLGVLTDEQAKKMSAGFDDIKVKADTKQAETALEGVRKKAEQEGDKAGSGFSNAFAAGIGGAIGGIAANLGQQLFSGLGDVLSNVQGFETGVKSLSAVTGATGPLLDDLASRARNLATQFGGNANDQLVVFQTTLSKIGPQLADSPEDLAKFAENVNILGKTDAALGAAGAVDALTGAMLQFGVDVNNSNEVAQESSRFINVLAASAAVGSASVKDVSDAVAVVGATAKNANVSFEETNAALQVLASKSLVGSQAGTGLATVLNKLQAQSTEGDDALKKLGTSSAELGNLLNTGGIGPAVSKLREAMAKLGTQAEKNALLNKLFGEGGQNAAAALLGGEAMLAQFTAGVTGTNSALDQAAVNMDTFAERMSRIKAQVGDAFIGAFQAVAPIISQVLDGIVPRITTAFQNVFSALGPTLKIIGTIFGGAVFAAVQVFVAIVERVGEGFKQLQPLLPIIAAGVAAYAIATNAAAIATTIAAAKQAILNLVMGANPIGAAVIVITAAVVAYGALADALEVTNEEVLDEAEAQKKSIETQIKSNQERQKSVLSTQAMVEEFRNLASNTKRTAEEEARLKTIQAELDKQYPGLIDQTKSFSENLDGVDKIGRQATDAMSGLVKQQTALTTQLSAANKAVAAAKRNVAVGELRDVLTNDAFLKDLMRISGNSAGAEFRTKFAAALGGFEKMIFSAKTEAELEKAQEKMLEFVNANAAMLGDSTKELELRDAINKVLATSLDAIKAYRNEADKIAETVPPPQPDPQPDPDALDKKVKSAKDTASALETALKLYREQASVIDGNTKLQKAEAQALLRQGKLTEDQFKRISAAADADAVLAKYNKAVETLRVTISDEGLFLNTNIKLGKDETDLEIRTVIAELAAARQYEVPVKVKLTFDPTAETNRVNERAKQLLKPLEVPVVIDSSLFNETDLTSAIDAIAKAFRGLSAEEKAAREESIQNIGEEERALTQSFKKGEVDIASFQGKMDELRTKRAAFGEDESLVDRLVGAAQDVAFDTINDKFNTLKDDAVKKFNELKDGGIVSLNELGKVVAFTFGAGLASAIQAGNLTFGSALAMLADAVLSAFELLVPLVGTQFLGFLGPIVGPALAAIAIAGLRAALTSATSDVGAESGVGVITKNYRGRRGPNDNINLWVAEGEGIANRAANRRNAGLVDFINKGGHYKDLALKEASRAELMKALDLKGMGITFTGMDAPAVKADIRNNSIVIDTRNLERKMDGMGRELKQLRELIAGKQTDIHIYPPKSTAPQTLTIGSMGF